MAPVDPLRDRLRLAVRVGGAAVACCVLGSVLWAVGVPDAVAYPLAAGAAVAGWSLADRLLRRPD